MKIAGTLPNQALEEKGDEKEAKVWEVNMDGLTAKQKKNLRKKLQRKRKKQQNGLDTQNQSRVDDNEESKDEIEE